MTMHEYSIIQALLERIEEEARRREARAVTAVRVAIGELSGVETELLATAYRTFRERTICEAAPLEIVPVAARWTCPRCQRAIAKGRALTCVACGLPARLLEGEEIVLERIEMEVA
jgi:hydrogenase nickel incorporation protein HypA/HybF